MLDSNKAEQNRIYESRNFSFKNEINDFRKYVNSSKVLKSCYIFNLSYFLINTIIYIVLLLTNSVGNTIYSFDFSVFYRSSEVIKINPSEIYTSALYDLPFRYLPIYPYIHFYLSYFPLPLMYILNNFLMYILHQISCVIILSICEKLYKIEINNKPFQTGFFFVFMAPLQFPNMMLGQNSSLVTLLLLISLFLLENDRLNIFKIRFSSVLSGLFIGISIIFKPVAVFLLPFVFSIYLNFKGGIKINLDFKRIEGILGGLFVTILPNIILFLIYPNLLSDFLTINLDQGNLEDYPSTSITRLIICQFDKLGLEYSRSMLTILITALLYIIPVIIFLLDNNKNKNLSVYFGYATLILLLSYPDSWFLYVYIWFMLQYSSFFKMEMYFKTKKEKIQKVIMKRILQYSMEFFFIGIIIHYLWLNYDIIAPVLYFIYYILYIKGHLKFRDISKIL